MDDFVLRYSNIASTTRTLNLFNLGKTYEEFASIQFLLAKFWLFESISIDHEFLQFGRSNSFVGHFTE